MVGEKPRLLKKTTRLRPTLFAVVALIAVERRLFNSLLPRIFFAFRFALNSDLSVFSTFTFDQTSELGSAFNSSE